MKLSASTLLTYIYQILTTFYIKNCEQAHALYLIETNAQKFVDQNKKVREKIHPKLSYCMTFSTHRIFTLCWKRNCLVSELHLGWYFFKHKHMIIKIMFEISHDTFFVVTGFYMRVTLALNGLSTFNKIHLKLFKLT